MPAVPSPKGIAHITTNHQPYDSRIFLKECVTLARAGYSVSLVVPHSQSLVRDGVKVVPIPPTTSRSERFLKSGWNALRAARSTGAQIFHLHDPDLLPVGWVLKAMGKTVIYDAHEDRPKQILSKQWIPRPLRPLVAAVTKVVESVSASMFDSVIAATPAIAATFPARNTTLVQNFPILGELQVADPRPHDQRPNQIIFVGGMSAIRGIRQIVDAMALVPVELGAKLILVGEFSPPAFRSQVEVSPGWTHTISKGFQDREAVAELLEDSRIGLVTYLPEPNHVAAQPNKLFEYMSAGIPVIASDFPLWRSLIEDAGSGLLVDPDNPEAIAEAISWILNNPAEAAEMGARGFEAVQERLNWDAESSELIALYARLSG